jgi:hypothetical protein
MEYPLAHLKSLDRKEAEIAKGLAELEEMLK